MAQPHGMPSADTTVAQAATKPKWLALALVLVCVLATVWMFRAAREPKGAPAASTPTSWATRYQAANQAALVTGRTPELDPLAAEATADPFRQQLMDHLIARIAYDQTLQFNARQFESAGVLDWSKQDPEMVQAYAEALLEQLDQAQAAGQFESAVSMAYAIAKAPGIFTGSQPAGRDFALKVATGRIMLSAGRKPPETLIQSVRDVLDAAPKALAAPLQLDAILMLAQHDLAGGLYGLTREKLESVALALDQTLSGASPAQLDMLEMRRANLSLQAGVFEATRQRLEPLVAKAETASRCHAFLDALLTKADIAVQQAQYTVAEQAYQRVQTCLNSKGPLAHFQQGQLQNGLGVLWTQVGRGEEAGQALEQAGQIWQQTLPALHPWIGSLYNNLGAWHRSQGNYHAARSDYEKAAGIWRQGLGDSHPVMASYHNNVGELDMLMSRLDNVKGSLTLALDMRRQAFGYEHPWTAVVVSNLGEYFALSGQPGLALEQHEMALGVRERTLERIHPDTAMSLNNLGAIHYGNQDFRVSLEKFKQAHEINRAALGDRHPRTLLSMSHLAANHMALGDFGTAETQLMQVVDGLRAQEPSSPVLHAALVKLGEAQLVLEKPDLAEKNHLGALELADQGDRRALLSASRVAYRSLVSLYRQQKNAQASRELARRYAWARP